jgi:hypothetical protein
LAALGEVLFAIRAGSFIGRAEELHDGDHVARVALLDFQVRHALNVDRRDDDAARCGGHGGRFTGGPNSSGLRDGYIRPTQQLSLGRGPLVNVNGDLDPGDELRAELATQLCRRDDNEPLVEIRPNIVLFQIGVHSGER